MKILGRGAGEALPALDSVPATYQVETNGELLYRLCIALVERHLVDERLWLESGKIPIVFARNAIHKMLDQACGNRFENNLEYACIVRDDLDTSYGHRRENAVGRLFGMFDLQTAGFMAMGEAMKALDNEEAYLGAAFYIALGRALRRWMLVYDHFAAECYTDQLRDMMEEDDPENREYYEFPLVEEAVPPSVKIVDGWSGPPTRKLLRRHQNGPYAAWIRKLFAIERLSRLKRNDVSVEWDYDSPPIPSVLIVFRERDAIHACWDCEAEHYNEANHEPSCEVAFRPDHSEEFDQAFRTMHIFLQLNLELAGLANMINEWEAEHASEPEHRREPALRAA